MQAYKVCNSHTKEPNKQEKLCGECYFWEQVTERIGRCSIWETVKKNVDKACKEFREKV